MVHFTEAFGKWIVVDFQLRYLEKTMAMLAPYQGETLFT